MKKPMKVPAINWEDESTWTLAGLSNWTAARDHKMESAKDAACSSVRTRYLHEFLDHIEGAPEWAQEMTSKVVFFALLAFKFADSPKEREYDAIQAIIETYTSPVQED